MFIQTLDEQFRNLHLDSVRLLAACPPDKLYWEPKSTPSLGECIVRSAGVVERTFGGLTANLWDDPFEWTLPESLQTPRDVAQYLNEVETTRKRGFALLRDDDLKKLIAIAPNELKPLDQVLRSTLANAVTWQSLAIEAFDLLQDGPVSGKTATSPGEL